MSTKFLDLDALDEREAITIKLKGVTHAFKEMSVEDFIWAQNKTKDVINAKEEGDYITATVEMLKRSFPTCSNEDLMALPLTKLRALNEFVMKLALFGAETAVKEGEKESGNVPAESLSQ